MSRSHGACCTPHGDDVRERGGGCPMPRQLRGGIAFSLAPGVRHIALRGRLRAQARRARSRMGRAPERGEILSTPPRQHQDLPSPKRDLLRWQRPQFPERRPSSRAGRSEVPASPRHDGALSRADPPPMPSRYARGYRFRAARRGGRCVPMLSRETMRESDTPR